MKKSPQFGLLALSRDDRFLYVAAIAGDEETQLFNRLGRRLSMR